jgi:hypothetical protein
MKMSCPKIVRAAPPNRNRGPIIGGKAWRRWLMMHEEIRRLTPRRKPRVNCGAP